MVGQLMVEAATASGLSPDLHLSLVERYSDGTELSEGLVQGIRFDIRGGVPSFRIGVGREERGDVTIEITAAAARELNRLRSDDPSYPTTREGFLVTGEMRVAGDPSRLGAWLAAVHDPIVARTILQGCYEPRVGNPPG
jgi:hypothetical protein